MKKIYYILLVMLVSCNTSSDYLEGISTNPLIILSNGGKEIVDTVKTTVHALSNYSTIPFIIKGNTLAKKVSIMEVYNTGSGYTDTTVKFYLNSSKIELSRESILEFDVLNGSNEIRILKNNWGYSWFKIKVKDSFDKSDEFLYKVYQFRNIDPVISWKFVERKVLSPYEYTIDASASYDPDAKYGGKIDTFMYKVSEDLLIKNTESKLNWIFPGPGTYNVEVTIKDNDGAFTYRSSIVTIN